MRGSMISDDLELEGKVADIIGLYLHRPQHAAVFGLDEKPSLRVTHWLGQIPPLSAGAIKWHGALSLYAAFGIGVGEVLSGIHSHQTVSDFVAFLTDVVA